MSTHITHKAYLAFISTVLSLGAFSISVASSPSSEFVYVGAPTFYAEMDAAGYSDWLFWGPSERHHAFQYHEVLSGEWGGAVYFDGIDTDLIDPNDPNSGKQAMWLTDKFLYPNWSTGSSFQISFSADSWDTQDNPVPADNYALDYIEDYGYVEMSANDTAHTIIITDDGKLEISIRYEVVDLGSSVDNGIGGSPLAFFVPDPNDPDEVEHYFVESDRYLFLQTYTFRNIDPNEQTVANLEFYQMLHSHANDNYDDVSMAYDDSDFWPDPLEDYTPYDPNHKSGNFRFDMTSWSPSGSNPSHNDSAEVDWVGFSSTVEPNWVECGFYRDGHSYAENNKPSRPGTHWNVEDRSLSGETYQYDQVAGAMGWHLGSLDPNETTSITLAFMFGTGPIKTMADVYPPIALEIDDDASDCVSPCPSQKTLSIDYSYLWNIPGWEAYSYSPSDVKDLELTCYLPPEVDFVSADPNQGYYDSNLHAYVWYVGDLTGGEGDTVDISVAINSSVIPGGDLITTVVADYTVSGIEYSQESDEYTIPVCECHCGNVIYVDKDATAGNDDGSSWASAYLKLQDALAEADVCDEIWVAEGTYTPADSFDKSATFTIPNGAKVYGGFTGTETYVYQRNWADNETILSGLFDPNEVDFVVTADSAVRWAVLDGFTIKYGAFAGVYCEGSSLYLEHSTITDNGFGIVCQSTLSPIIRNNLIYGNTIGMAFDTCQDTAIVRNNTIVDNDPTGVYCDSDIEPSIKNCIFWGHADANDMVGCYATYSCIQHPADFYDESDPNTYLGIGEGNIDDNPSFATGSYHLASDSPCIDTGDPNETYHHQRDIDRQFRVLYEAVDMGADEYYDCTYVSQADFNNDGTVNLLDYAEFAAHWMETDSDPNWNGLYDLADDEVIDEYDLALFADEWLWMDCDTMAGFPLEDMQNIETSYESTMMVSAFSSSTLMATQAEPTLKEQVDTAQEVIDWLENLWKTDKELRKNIDKQDWDAFMDRIYEWFYSLEDLYEYEQHETAP